MTGAVAESGLPAMAAAYATAAAAKPSEVHAASMTICGRAATIAVAGHALAGHVLPAFAHLIEEAGPGSERPLASIQLWDSAVTGVGRPVLPGGAEWLSYGQGWQISMFGGSRYLCEERAGSVICLDRATGGVVALYDDGTRLTLADRARPLQRMMSQICASFGVQDVHAALVARSGRGALIVGGSGRGKTSTAVDCLSGGLDFLGDDSVGITGSPGSGFLGYSLYASARVLPDQLTRWPRLAGAWVHPGPGDDKALLLPGQWSPSPVVRTTRIVAVVVPVVAGGRLRITSASPRDAFKALVFDSGDNRRFGMTAGDFRRFTALVTTVPCYRVELDADPERVADGIAGLIEKAPQ